MSYYDFSGYANQPKEETNMQMFVYVLILGFTHNTTPHTQCVSRDRGKIDDYVSEALFLKYDVIKVEKWDIYSGKQISVEIIR